MEASQILDRFFAVASHFMLFFHQGFSQKVKRAGYVQRRPIYQLFWCLEYVEPSPEHIADTQHVCKQLGIPPLAHFEE